MSVSVQHLWLGVYAITWREIAKFLRQTERLLSALEQQGVVQRHAFESATARFETADAPHHDHLIDIDTGAVIEFRSDKIEQLQAEIAAELGYELVRHRLELYCRKRKG